MKIHSMRCAFQRGNKVRREPHPMILGKNMEAGSCVKDFCLESSDSPSARKEKKKKDPRHVQTITKCKSKNVKSKQKYEHSNRNKVSA